jgi:hypothetical protein
LLMVLFTKECLTTSVCLIIIITTTLTCSVCNILRSSDGSNFSTKFSSQY